MINHLNKSPLHFCFIVAIPTICLNFDPASSSVCLLNIKQINSTIDVSKRLAYLLLSICISAFLDLELSCGLFSIDPMSYCRSVQLLSGQGPHAPGCTTCHGDHTSMGQGWAISCNSNPNNNINDDSTCMCVFLSCFS